MLGARIVIHSGAVIAADGFGFEVVEGRHEKVPQIGIVQIDDDVEIGANTTIDRARFGRTWIKTRREDRQPGADRAQRGRRPALDHRRASRDRGEFPRR